MKRLIITAPRCAEFEEIMMPVCPSDGLLVRARVTAISTGTEIRVYRVVPVDAAGQYIHANIPLVFPIENGYSMVGDVIEVGSEVSNFVPGDRVFTAATHREIAAVPAADAFKLPATIPDEQAVFVNILEVSHIALRKGSPTPGDTLGIIGQGVIGLAALAYGQAFGFRTLVVDKEDARLAIARRMGAGLAISPDAPDFMQQVHDFTEGQGADLVLEAASTWAAIQMSMDIVSKGGKVVVVARHTDQPQFSPVGDPYLQKDITLLTSYGYPPAGQRWDRQRSFALTFDLMAREKLSIGPMITHHFPWQALPEVYQRLEQGERELVGVVIDWRK